MQRMYGPRAVAVVIGAVGVLAVALLASRPADRAEVPDGADTLPAPAAAPDPDTGASTTPDTSAAEAQEGPTPRGELRVPSAGWRTDFEIGSVDLGEIIGGGPPKDGIPSIDAPQLESIEGARSWLDERSPVIALEIAGEARGYPLAILIWHEIVNDTLAGVPVVVTFCPLCNTALVFEREVGGVNYDFGTTGNLRFSDLVMYDRQTESWWQQATGEAIVGVLTGTRLPFVAAQIVSLADFEATYPEGDMLSRDTGHVRDYGGNPYIGYDTVDQQPFLFRGEVDGRLSPMERVVTLSRGGESAAYPYSELEKVGVVDEEVGGLPVVVFWQSGVSSALDAPRIDDGRDVGATGVFSPVLDGRRLSFGQADADGMLRDLETGSTWAVTGVATDGPLVGQRLEALSHGDHFWFAWAAFEPDTRIWTASE
jgi:hypothetical protein